jgi:hypothetical protein
MPSLIILFVIVLLVKEVPTISNKLSEILSGLCTCLKAFSLHHLYEKELCLGTC